MAATVHLICGATGSGKTTYAETLAQRLGAVRFSLDEAMMTLFGADRPDDAPFEWYNERIQRVEHDMWQMVTRLTPLGVDAVLDLGFSLKQHRAAFRQRADDAGLDVRLHVLDVPAEERWSRVEARNRERGETYAMDVTRPMFDFVEAMFEAPDSAELAAFGGKIVETGS